MYKTTGSVEKMHFDRMLFLLLKQILFDGLSEDQGVKLNDQKVIGPTIYKAWTRTPYLYKGARRTMVLRV